METTQVWSERVLLSAFTPEFNDNYSIYSFLQKGMHVHTYKENKPLVPRDVGVAKITKAAK